MLPVSPVQGSSIMDLKAALPTRRTGAGCAKREVTGTSDELERVRGNLEPVTAEDRPVGVMSAN